MWSQKSKNKSKMLYRSVWHVKRSALKRRFQKYPALLYCFIRSRIIAQKTKLKKTGFWLCDHKRVSFQYFQKRKNAPFSTVLYLSCIWVYESHNKNATTVRNVTVRFRFFAQKGVFNFRNWKQTAERTLSLIVLYAVEIKNRNVDWFVLKSVRLFYHIQGT